VRRLRTVGLVLLAACSSLSPQNGVVVLEVRLPSPTAVEPGDTLPLLARALDANGDSVAATIVWSTPDTTLIVDPTGRVTTLLTSGTGRVQAANGSLRSDLFTIQIRPASDTLRLTGADTQTVALIDSVSLALLAAVESDSPAGGVSGTRILYQVIPADTAAASGTLRFSNGLLTLAATTGSTGEPATPVTLRKVSGSTSPDSVRVAVSATRPSGAVVPGSGQLFIVRFLSQ